MSQSKPARRWRRVRRFGRVVPLCLIAGAVLWACWENWHLERALAEIRRSGAPPPRFVHPFT